MVCCHVLLACAGHAASSAASSQSGQAPQGTHEETIHTTAKHPWLTADEGWVIAGQLQVGEPVVQADGKRAVVVAVRVIPGAGTMYDLEVSRIHTFEVGIEQYVVHNCAGDSKNINLDNLQKLQHMYDKHATDWGGFAGKQWRKEGAAFKQALIDHLEDPFTHGIPGKYRGKPVTHYYNPVTDLDLMVDPSKEIAGGWRLAPSQLWHLLGGNGNVQ